MNAERNEAGLKAEAATAHLKKSGKTVATAESCTGGLLGKLITDNPGVSEFYLGGAVCYSNEAKIRLLGVSERTISEHGAVSRETAEEMAEGIRKKLGADIGVSTTGIAGPGGGTEKKPVGLVYVGISDGSGVRSHELRLGSGLSRDEIRNSTAEFVFTLLSDSE
ncbi:MAG: nicotinamide-nucleotide amidohydrolase family protein [Clostridia bacterium]|nr:nicotinamide-nucleotide amidohydrolase family protein [Clostridia bacterium]